VRAKAILFIDDELGADQDTPDASYMSYYLQALRERGFQVMVATGADSALQQLADNSENMGLIVLDIMMPPGKAFANDDTRGGLRTGVLLAEHIAQAYPDIPMMVLTNIPDPDERKEIESQKNVVRTLFKPYCTPFELAQEVQDFVGSQDA